MTDTDLLRIVCLLDAKPRTSVELCEILRCDKRTLERAIAELGVRGVKIESDREAGWVRRLESDPTCPTCGQDLETATVRRWAAR